jgi:ABC-type phosphate/phosphonate transport system substrate-binding protein
MRTSRVSALHCVSALLLIAIVTVFALPGWSVRGQQAKSDVLRIGTSGSLTGQAESSAREKTGTEELKSFIKEETGMDNEIIRQKTLQDLTEQMAQKKLQLGVFQGYEFAWAQEKHAELKPLALAVNVYTYPTAYIVTRRDNAATDFAGLKGQSLVIPATGQGFLRLFVDHESEANGQNADKFLSKISSADNVEDALDSVVDGKIQAAIADRAAMEAYKDRKPGRFKQLKEVAKSGPFPPALVAYYDAVVDEGTLKRFKDSLLGSSKKEKGQTLLTMFHLSGFVDVPSDFDKVLADTRKTYPAPGAKK